MHREPRGPEGWLVLLVAGMTSHVPLGGGPAAAVTALGSVIGTLSPEVLGVLKATLTHPFRLGVGVAGAWTVMRDIAAGLLLVVLLYGVLRSQVAELVGLEAEQPWRLLLRLPLAAIGVATSLALVRGLLLANNVLCAAILRGVPQGAPGLMHPLAGGLALTLVPAALGIGPAMASLLVLIGIAALACFYVIRAAEIVLLTLLLPLAAALWVVPAAGGVWRALMAELLVAVFVQSAQVTVLLVFAAGMGGAGAPEGAPWLWSLGALTLVFRCRGLLNAAIQAGGQLGPHPGGVAAGARVAAGVAARGANGLSWIGVRGSQVIGD